MDAPRGFDDGELFAALDFYREAVVRKIEGLTREQAVQFVLPSGVTLLGIVHHLTAVENEWFAHLLDGTEMDEYDNDATFVVPVDRTVTDIVDDYTHTCARSRRILDGHSLDDVTERPHLVLRAHDRAIRAVPPGAGDLTPCRAHGRAARADRRHHRVLTGSPVGCVERS